MATEILLTSETFVKAATGISDNLAFKYLRAAIRETQEVDFRRIVGDTLLSALKEMVSDGSIEDDENAAYKDLVDRSQYFLAYSAIADVAMKTTFKVANAGVVKTPDEKMEVVGVDDLAKVREYYQAKADSACLDLQNFILNNRDDYPELTEGDCHRIRACLYSAASCGIFLGGARGKAIGRPLTCNKD